MCVGMLKRCRANGDIHLGSVISLTVTTGIVITTVSDMRFSHGVAVYVFGR
jgi:hypothetical protein